MALPANSAMVEVSRNVVAILLVLVVVVSGFGTYSLISRERADEAVGYAPAPAGAAVDLRVVPRDDDGKLQLSVQNDAANIAR